MSTKEAKAKDEEVNRESSFFKKLGLVLDRIIYRGTDVCRILAVCAVLFLFILIFVNVFLRYFFNSPYKYADEIVRFTMAWLIYLGMAYTLREGAHIAINVFTMRLKPLARERFERIGNLLVLIWIAMLTYGGWNLWLDMFESEQRSFGLLQVELWLPGLCIVFGLSWFLLETLRETVKRFLVPAKEAK